MIVVGRHDPSLVRVVLLIAVVLGVASTLLAAVKSGRFAHFVVCHGDTPAVMAREIPADNPTTKQITTAEPTMMAMMASVMSAANRPGVMTADPAQSSAPTRQVHRG